MSNDARKPPRNRRRAEPPPPAVITVSYAEPGTGAPSRAECVARALDILLKDPLPCEVAEEVREAA